MGAASELDAPVVHTDTLGCNPRTAPALISTMRGYTPRSSMRFSARNFSSMASAFFTSRTLSISASRMADVLADWSSAILDFCCNPAFMMASEASALATFASLWLANTVVSVSIWIPACFARPFWLLAYMAVSASTFAAFILV